MQFVLVVDLAKGERNGALQNVPALIRREGLRRQEEIDPTNKAI